MILCSEQREKMSFSKDEKFFFRLLINLQIFALENGWSKLLSSKALSRTWEKSFKDWLKTQPSALETEVPAVITEILTETKSTAVEVCF